MLRAFLPIKRNGSCFAIRAYRTKKTINDRAGVRIHHGIFKDLDTLEDDPDNSYEGDFTQLHKSHRDHEEEMLFQKEQVKYYVIKNKYFKSEKQPNFLTWAEKEQIRYLNKTGPEEWTPERLSESFPAIEDVVIKVLKAKWSPANMRRVQKHDAVVKRNWNLFKTNQMKNLDPDTKEHLKKFSDRNFDNIQNAYVQTNKDQFNFQFPKPKSNEFLRIFSSCKRINTDTKKKSIDSISNPEIMENKKKDQSLLASKKNVESNVKLPKNKGNQILTFDELKDITKSNLAKSQEQEQQDSIASLLKQSNETDVHNVHDDIAITTKMSATKVTHIDEFKEEPSDSNVVELTLDHISSSKMVTKYATKTSFPTGNFFNKTTPTAFRPKIDIPKRLRKNGSVYRLYDCFYDNRGQFLYRVPGLSH